MNGLVIGRYRIPHTGHLALVQRAIAETTGTVFIAIVGSDDISSAEEREFQFRHLIISQGLQHLLPRSQFLVVTNAYVAIEHLMQQEAETSIPYNIYCGEDRFRSYCCILARFPESLASVVVTDRPEGSVSSTWCRSASREQLLETFNDFTYVEAVLAMRARGC